MTVLIKNGEVYFEDSLSPLDIYIENEKIKYIGKDLNYDAKKVIDVKGKLILPGAVDVHTHFCLDLGEFVAVDDFYTGTRAAAFGGTTTIVDHIGFFGKDASLNQMIDNYHELADDNALVDYSFHGAIENADEDHLAEFEDLIDRGIISLKLYTTYGGMLEDDEILKTLKKAKETGMIVCVHAENDGAIKALREEAKIAGNNEPIYHAKTRPPETEAEAINRLIYLSELTGSPDLYFVHVSSELGLNEILAARDRGVENLYIETCTQYLLLDDSYYYKDGPKVGTKYIMAPPLRTESDQDALWESIAKGEIDVVATDHCPFFYETEKSKYKDNFFEAPGGGPGVEERLEVVLTEGLKRGIPLERLIDVLIKNPAKIFGLKDKGQIKQGKDADLVILKKSGYEITDDNRHSNVDYSSYSGYETDYKVETVISRGDIIVDKDELIGDKGRGIYIKREIGE